ncbi:AGE family epimerase/isomerase [Cyclobacterium sp. SYSU L10401]|uniref:AGE family epimerase/isomerase n=1 Tax=Cyclobacterium sp. SYSU L10401 TaxID=2678657 RepID=UPI0013D1670E|nr:AGE family epimerase/isomerase [Cyclobacterium sp. SYSU L10401]
MTVYLNALFLLLLQLISPSTVAQEAARMAIAEEVRNSIENEMINRWYPNAYDHENGGYVSSFEYDFSPSENQNKMIVSQARHLWTLSKLMERYPDTSHYAAGAKLGLDFLINKFWDQEHGGFFTLLDRKGNVLENNQGAKTAYGNAFGIYGLAAYHHASGDPSALEWAKKAFYWLEKNSYDPEFGGYFQSLERDGTPSKRNEQTPSTATTGYKDQNSSIHLLEAFTELYQVWKDPLLKRRTEELLVIIRDTIVQNEGYLQLFLLADWTPVSFRDQGRSAIEKHHNIDHVSYGHDVETAYLMMEASHVLGLTNDYKTWEIGKKMVDHALMHGWDGQSGGFYDGGYYFPEEDAPEIVKDTKNWWAQAEGLNTLLIMADLYPDDPMEYFAKFKQQWNYIQQNLIDHAYGGWYSGGLDKQPELKNGQKGHIWKTAYHNFRSLHNCDLKLRDPSHLALTIKSKE